MLRRQIWRKICVSFFWGDDTQRELFFEDEVIFTEFGIVKDFCLNGLEDKLDLHCSNMPAKITEVYDVATKIASCGSSTLGSDTSVIPTLKMEGIEAQSWTAKQPK